MKISLSVKVWVITLLSFSLTSVFSSIPYEVYAKDLDTPFVQTSPVRESFNIGGFHLTVNITKMGYTVYSNPRGNILGVLQDNDCYCKVIKIPLTHTALEVVARQMSYEPNTHFTITHIHTKYGIKGIRTTCGSKPNIFSDNIIKTKYFFINNQGEIIWFSATAKTHSPDWQYFNYIVTERLGFSKN